MTDPLNGFTTSAVSLSPVHSPLMKSCMGEVSFRGLANGNKKAPCSRGLFGKVGQWSGYGGDFLVEEFVAPV